MKKLSFILVLFLGCYVLKAQTYRDAQKLTETFSTDDNLVKTVDMDLTSGLAQIGYLRPTAGTLSNTPSNINTATRMHFTHLSSFAPGATATNKLIMPKAENPNYLDNDKKYYPTEIRKISDGYIVCGYMEGTCNPGATKSAFMMKIDNNGSPLLYKSYTVSTNPNDYIVLNSVAPARDGLPDYGFVACGYKWDNTNQRKKAIVVVADDNLNVIATREVNEPAIFVSELSANVFPNSYYTKIVSHPTNNEFYLLGASGVVSVATPSAPDGIAYYRGDVLFSRCSTDVTLTPAPIFFTSQNFFSVTTDVVELGVSLIPGNTISSPADYIFLVDHIVDQFNGSQFVSRNSTIAFLSVSQVHLANNPSVTNPTTWFGGGLYGRIDYQNTNHERGVDIILDNTNTMYILCSYDGVRKPIESQLSVSGSQILTGQGDDYIGGLPGELVPRDLEPDASGHKILTHYENTPHTEKINPLNYLTGPFQPNCVGAPHNVATFSYGINRGNGRSHQTPSIYTCEVLMEDYEIPVTVTDPCGGNRPGQGGSFQEDGLDNGGQPGEAIAYPNPATNRIKLNFGETLPENATLEVVGVNGQVLITVENIKAAADGSVLEIDISSLADGIYFCKITGGDELQPQIRFQKISSR